MNQGKGIVNMAKGVYMITGRGMVEHGGTIKDKFMYLGAVGRAMASGRIGPGAM